MAPKFGKNDNFRYKFAQKRIIPLSDFHEISHGTESQAPYFCQISPLSPKLVIFGINLPKRGIHLKQFL